MVITAHAMAATTEAKRVFMEVMAKFLLSVAVDQATRLETGAIAGATLKPTVRTAQTTAANRAVK
jgi:hypothetical protein